MGAYLNRPIVEKEKEEGSGDGFSYACTTMQGWRVSQEDAHNCVVDIHDKWHMFAVYDGHGGSEVSKFTSAKFPNFLKDYKFWESDNLEDCLQRAFVDFDNFIRSDDSMKQLKALCNEGRPEQQKSAPGDDSEDEADRIGTIEESAIPIAELIRRYGGAGTGKALLSAFLERGDNGISSDDEDEQEEGEEEEAAEEGEKKEEEEGEEKPTASETKEEEAGEKDIAENVEESKEKKSPAKKSKVQKRCSKSPIQSEAKKSKSDESEAATSSSSAPDQAKEADDDDSDKEFVADEEEEADDEQSDEEDVDDEEEMTSATAGVEVPGEDSGTTACVVLIGDNKVIVANAGDSRAILCRAGKAIELSVDHKPEDPIETARIHAAGGIIEDGRVNGGLNLSRALGDHSYKKRGHMLLKDQMITAHPDVKIETLTPEDEFLIVACDGIWNSMESQQVADFVKKLIADGNTCSEICDALCDECLAPTTDGDGTGCDNMTVICTIFKR